MTLVYWSLCALLSLLLLAPAVRVFQRLDEAVVSWWWNRPMRKQERAYLKGERRAWVEARREWDRPINTIRRDPSPQRRTR